MAYADTVVSPGPQSGDLVRLFEMTVDLLAVVEADGRYSVLSPSWEDVLGWTREELVAAAPLEFVHPDDRAMTLALLEHTAEAGYVCSDLETRHRCRDGSHRRLAWRARTDGARWYAVARDVTVSKGHEDDQLSRMRSAIVARTQESRLSAGALEIAETEIVRRLSMAVEWRDDDTGRHIDRVSRFSGLLAQRAATDPELWEPMRFASPLHDAGKVAIPDAILLKPGPLTPAERAIMQTHSARGHELLRGSASPILELAAMIAWTHHERFDGTGYPRGLRGEEIPIEGRIVAIVDVYDALTSDRVYRPAFPPKTVLAMMVEGRGSHFDPRLLDIFLDAIGDPAQPAEAA